MYKPTDEEINAACAEVCGWRVEFGTTHWHIKNGQGKTVVIYPQERDAQYFFPYTVPKFATDRNDLPELLRVVWEAGHTARRLYAAHVWNNHVIGEFRTGVEDGMRGVWIGVEASPRLHCIAALKALGHWPDDEWDTEP